MVDPFNQYYNDYNVLLYCCYMGGRTSLADPVTAGPMFSARKASRCDLRSPKFQRFPMILLDNWLLGRGASNCWTGMDYGNVM